MVSRAHLTYSTQWNSQVTIGEAPIRGLPGYDAENLAMDNSVDIFKNATPWMLKTPNMPKDTKLNQEYLQQKSDIEKIRHICHCMYSRIFHHVHVFYGEYSTFMSQIPNKRRDT